jgi:superfamily II RNA helicase
MFAYDRDNEINIIVKDLPPKLTAAIKKIMLAVRPLMRRLNAAGFVTSKLYPAAGAAMYYWAQGHSWESIIRATGIAEGDMATLVLRTADNLRQIASLKDTHPDVAACAYRAREAILREPVLFL